MSLVLNGSGQYGIRSAITHPGRPVWFGGIFKPTSLASVQCLCGAYSPTNLTRQENLIVSASVVRTEEVTSAGANGAADGTPGSAGAWTWSANFFSTATLRSNYKGTTKTDNTTNVSPTYADITAFLCGSRFVSGAASAALAGRAAHLFFGTGAFSESEWAQVVAGTRSPATLTGVAHYWSLESNANDTVGSWNLTLVGSPTFDAADQPSVTATQQILSSGLARLL